MVISLNDVGIITAMSLVHIGELTEPCRISAWYQSLFHSANTFAHSILNATLAFVVLVINAHCSGETVSQVDEFNNSLFVHSQ